MHLGVTVELLCDLLLAQSEFVQRAVTGGVVAVPLARAALDDDVRLRVQPFTRSVVASSVCDNDFQVG